MRTLIRVAVKSHKLHFIPEFALAALLSSFFCKSKCIEDVGCSKIRTLCCSPPGLNLGCDIGLDGVTAASLTFFFGLAPDFGVASEIHKKILWPWHDCPGSSGPPECIWTWWGQIVSKWALYPTQIVFDEKIIPGLAEFINFAEYCPYILFWYSIVKDSSADLGVSFKIVQNRPTVKAACTKISKKKFLHICQYFCISERK